MRTCGGAGAPTGDAYHLGAQLRGDPGLDRRCVVRKEQPGLQPGPRGVREMRMMEKPGWKAPHAGWKAQDVVEHAREIFFSEEEIKMGARRF